MTDTVKPQELPPLAITCTSTDCKNEQHCFKQTRKMSDSQRGRCRSCGADLIDWERVHTRDLDDSAFTFESLKYERIRHHYWHIPIDQQAENHARRKGRIKLKQAVQTRLHKSVGLAKPARDGIQTPGQGNIIFYAQHALACCCRTCMEYWHGIPKGTELSEDQIVYFTELVMMYINERMPNLTEFGEKIPFIQRKTEE